MSNGPSNIPHATRALAANPQEVDNKLRMMVSKHMGSLAQGNPSQWVMDAVHEAFQLGFGLGRYAAPPAAQAQPTAEVVKPRLLSAPRVRLDHDGYAMRDIDPEMEAN